MVNCLQTSVLKFKAFTLRYKTRKSSRNWPKFGTEVGCRIDLDFDTNVVSEVVSHGPLDSYLLYQSRSHSDFDTKVASEIGTGQTSVQKSDGEVT